MVFVPLFPFHLAMGKGRNSYSTFDLFYQRVLIDLRSSNGIFQVICLIFKIVKAFILLITLPVFLILQYHK